MRKIFYLPMIFLMILPQVFAMSGKFDLTFGSGGRFHSAAFDPPLYSVEDMAIQADGKIVIVGHRSENGTSASDFFVARFNRNGSFDTTFGNGNGFVMTDTHPTSGSTYNSDHGYAVAIQNDGKIVVAGSGFGNAATVIRYNSDGTLDPSFGGNGIAGRNLSTTHGTVAYDMVIAPNGEIVLVGTVGSTSGSDSAVIVFTSDGSNARTLTAQVSNNSNVFNSVAVQADGKIVAAGSMWISGNPNGIGMSVKRYNSDLTLDTTFNGGGTLEIQFTNGTDIANSVALQNDGKIVIAGYSDSTSSPPDISLARLNSNGTFDNSFGNNGIVIANVGNGNDVSDDVFVQNDGKILVVGYAENPTIDFVLLRYNSDGSLDNSFGQGGKIFINFGNSERAYAVKIDPTGKIVVAGEHWAGATAARRIVMARLSLGNARFDFDGDRQTDISIFRPAVGEWWIQKSFDIGVRAFQFGSPNDKIVPADFTGDGIIDAAFFRPSTGSWFIIRSEDFSYYSFPFGANGDIPIPADFDGDGKADPAVFRPTTSIWYISKSTGGIRIEQFGANGDVPLAPDFDGDGLFDLAIFRPGNGEWWYKQSSDNSVRAVQFGNPGDKPVTSDFTGDGKWDIAFWRPSNGTWFVLRSEDSSYYAAPFGANSDFPVPDDYDGDGKADFAVWRPADRNWYVLKSTSGLAIIPFGSAGDQAVPSAYIP